MLLAPALLDPLGAAGVARPGARAGRARRLGARGRTARPSPRAARPRTSCGRCGRRAGCAALAAGQRAPAVSPARRPTATWTPWSSCSTQPPDSPTACPVRSSTASPTTSRRSRCPATRCPRARPETETVTVLTAHASKGLEWDLVCVAQVQEGSWPDLRRRGSLLGSELLVDVLAGRDVAGPATADAAGRGAPAVLRRRHAGATRARRHRGVRRRGAAVPLPRRARPGRRRAPADPRRTAACIWAGWSPSCGRRLRPGRVRRASARAAAAELARLAAARRPRRRPGHVVGAGRALRRRPGRRPGPAGAGEPVAHRLVPALRAARRAAGSRREGRRHDLGVAGHARARGGGDRAAGRDARRPRGACSTSSGPGSTSARGWFAVERAQARHPHPRPARAVARRQPRRARADRHRAGLRASRSATPCSPAGSTGSSATATATSS